MIKRFTFVDQPPGLAPSDLRTAWTLVAGRLPTAPSGARPVLVALSTARTPTGPEPTVHDAVVEEWFADEAALAGHDAWSAAPVGRDVVGPLTEVLHRCRTAAVVADEVVVRGPAWLDHHRRVGGERGKHVALAWRAPGVSAPALAAGWAAEAGRVRTADGGHRTIPEAVRGQAYVQHHPRPGGTWAYDAVNEVYFDDPRDLDERVAWFARHPPAAAGPLFRSPRFLVVTEASVPV